MTECKEYNIKTGKCNIAEKKGYTQRCKLKGNNDACKGYKKEDIVNV